MNLAPHELPDAAFMVASVPSKVAGWLVKEHGYRLVPLRFAKAFSRHGVLAPAGDRTDLLPEHLYGAEIPAFAYGVAPAVPPDSIKTIGTRLLLVASRGVPPGAAERLTEVAYESAFAKICDPPLSSTLLDQPAEIAWHEGTRRYIRASRPMIQADVIDLTEKLVAIGAAVVGGVFFLATWLVQRTRRARARGFDAHMDRVAAIEREALELEAGPRLDADTLLDLRKRLSQLKGEALDRFAEGTLMGDELMASFLIHVNDVRQHLGALMLHAREHPRQPARTPRSEAPGGPPPREQALPTNER
jgi:hypothetical protein